MNIQIFRFTLVLAAALFSASVASQVVIQPSKWIPPQAKEGLANQLSGRFQTGILAEKNDAQVLSEAAIKLVNSFDAYLFDAGVKAIIDHAPVFQVSNTPAAQEAALDAMGRYQLCNASLTLSLPPHYTPKTTDEQFNPTVGLTLFTMAVFYLQGSRELPISTFEAYATSDEMGIFVERMQDDPEVRAAFIEDCNKPLKVFVEAIS